MQRRALKRLSSQVKAANLDLPGCLCPFHRDRVSASFVSGVGKQNKIRSCEPVLSAFQTKIQDGRACTYSKVARMRGIFWKLGLIYLLIALSAVSLDADGIPPTHLSMYSGFM